MTIRYSIRYSENFRKQALSLPYNTKQLLKKKILLFLKNPRHPSLRTKKIKGQGNIFELSINMNIRITWQYTEDGFFFRNIGEHDKTLKTP